MIFGIALVVSVLAVLLDYYIPGRQKRKRAENVFCLLALTAGIGILLLYSLDVPLPNPTKAIESVIEMIVPIG